LRCSSNGCGFEVGALGSVPSLWEKYFSEFGHWENGVLRGRQFGGFLGGLLRGWGALVRVYGLTRFCNLALMKRINPDARG
jgi:hypothetical protein